MAYEIIRMFADDRETEVIETGLTLEEAQEHCQDPETSSKTCEVNEIGGQWFDGYREA